MIKFENTLVLEHLLNKEFFTETNLGMITYQLHASSKHLVKLMGNEGISHINRADYYRLDSFIGIQIRELTYQIIS